ncbi:hypothetical protein [Silvimonas sp.]|uniref:hypothetical protein n=1 Tax=Silvimonas sp. TaxID=2650811 RepID=UPI00283AC3FE|nr:hypothetical protein [Silvimonas sp.]MDR3429576.1 hypothetical protein [Silvimonas sp.]
MPQLRNRKSISGRALSKYAQRFAPSIPVSTQRARNISDCEQKPGGKGATFETVIPEFAQALVNGDVVDLILPGADVPIERDGITRTQAILLDPDQPHLTAERIAYGCRYLLMRNLLQNVKDYRSLLRTSFARLAIDGWLLITVPHQFLAERKFRLPSRYGSKALRFYTPASLAAEIEEALDITQYRIRFLQEDDALYDYGRPIRDRPEGHQRIILALQKISRPAWADEMDLGDSVEVPYDRNDRILPANLAPAVTHVLASAPATIKSILVIKLDHRGDYLLAQPALRQLRARFANSHITLVCGTWNAGDAQSSGLFDQIVPFNFFGEDASAKREPNREIAARQFADLMEGHSFDLAIDLRFFDDTRHLLSLVRAKYRAGFDGLANFSWLDIKLNLPSPTRDGQATQGFWPSEAFSCHERHRVDGAILCALPPKLSVRNELVVWGPYASLEAGQYELVVQVDARARGRHVMVDVVCDQAQITLFVGKIKVDAKGEGVVGLHVPDHLHGVELRVYSQRPFERGYRFRGVRYRKMGSIVGVHQRESMMLLVELVAMRLQLPYSQDQQRDDMR